jgi:hypothetical protein
MVIVKATDNSEAGVMPEETLLSDMTRFNEKLVEAGVMLAGDGLKPSSEGKRITFSGARRLITDGPFAETKELIAGYWIWEVKSMDEALEWAKQCPDPMPGEEAVLEIRPLYQVEDFGDAATPELLEKNAQMREQIERQQGR